MKNYWMVIASLGQTSTHVPHSVHASASTTATSSSSMAPTGHSSTHVPHAVHFSASTTAGMITPPRMLQDSGYNLCAFWLSESTVQMQKGKRKNSKTDSKTGVFLSRNLSSDSKQ